MIVDINLYSQILKLYGVYNCSSIYENNQPIFPDVQQSDIEIAVRRLLSKPLSMLPEAVFLSVTRVLKTALQKGHKNLFSTGHLIEEIIKDSRIQGKGLWSSQPMPLVLTHDVDLNSCFRNIEKIASIENGLGISSTWHFLTNGRYKLERSILDGLVSSGHEIGLHGSWHDIALGFRPTLYQAKMIEKGLHALAEYSPVSFRAPGLAWTPALSKVLVDNGIRADSSLRNYNSGWGIFRPVPINNGKLWELPLTLQDDYLFKNLRLREKDAGILISKVLNEADKRQTPAVLNFHPSIIKDRVGWYEETFKEIIGNKKWTVVKVSDIVKQLDEAWQRSGDDE